MNVEKSFLGIAREDEVRVNEVLWRERKIFWWMKIYQLRELFIKEDTTLLDNENVLTNSFGWVVETHSVNY